jgi:hypothetical protein
MASVFHLPDDGATPVEQDLAASGAESSPLPLLLLLLLLDLEQRREPAAE